MSANSHPSSADRQWARDRFAELLATRMEAGSDPDIAGPLYLATVGEMLSGASLDRVVALLTIGVEHAWISAHLYESEPAARAHLISEVLDVWVANP